MEPFGFQSLGTFLASVSPVSSLGGEAIRIGKRSLSLALEAIPRGVACAVEARNRDGSGVAPGAKTFLGVVAEILGENAAAGGLSVIVEARKMLRAEARLLLVRLLGA